MVEDRIPAAPLDTNRSPGETSSPGKLITTELLLRSSSLRGQKRRERGREKEMKQGGQEGGK